MSWLASRVECRLVRVEAPAKERPDPRVAAWLRANERELVVDPFILGELRFGILLLPKGGRRRRLESWFDSGVSSVVCLPWDGQSGLVWADLLAMLRSSGKAMPVKDSLIAATAIRHHLVVATRNVDDFLKAGVRVVDPFAA